MWDGSVFQAEEPELVDLDVVLAAPGHAVVSRGDRIYVVGRSKPDKPDSPLLLWRDALARGSARGELVRLGTLDHAARDVRAVDLVGGLLLIVEQNRVSAYTLP